MKLDTSRLADELATLCASRDFKDILAEWNRFSPFRVMRAERQEIRHTTTLAWLLDPRGSHQLGAAFLESFLQQLPDFGDFSLAQANPGQAQVYREISLSRKGDEPWLTLEQEEELGDSQKLTGNRLDVLVEGRSKSQRRWAIAIEAKIGSKQAPGQLPAYARHLKARFDKADLLMLYLTVNDDEPEGCAEWVNVLWGTTVADALEKTLKVRPAIDPRVREFLDDYLALLRQVSGDASAGPMQKIAGFANQGDAAPILRKLKWHSKELREVRGWSEHAWQRTFWQHESLLRKCMAEVYDPSAMLLWQTVRERLAPQARFTIITDGGNDSLAVQFVSNEWRAETPLRDGAAWNLCYHAEFRSVQKDIELKLYLPRGRNLESQKALVRELDQRKLLGSAFHPKPGPLANYLTPSGKTLKLESMTLEWSLREDGTIGIDSKALDAFCDDFEKRCAVHNAAIQAVFGRRP